MKKDAFEAGFLAGKAGLSLDEGWVAFTRGEAVRHLHKFFATLTLGEDRYSKRALYLIYVTWCASHDCTPVSTSMFGRELRVRLPFILITASEYRNIHIGA